MRLNFYTAAALVPLGFAAILAASRISAQSPAPQSTNTQYDSPVMAPTPVSRLTGPFAIETSSSMLLMSLPYDLSEVVFSGGLLVVEGLAPKLGKTPPLNCTINGWSVPEKPESVSITLTTKDGKKWRAKWVPDEAK